MTRKSNKFPADEDPSGEENAVVSERVQELTWALLDECATEEDMALLDNLLLSDAKARKAYIDCILLHSDLMAHYASPPSDCSETAQKSPVLGFLNQEIPPLGMPSAEGLK